MRQIRQVFGLIHARPEAERPAAAADPHARPRACGRSRATPRASASAGSRSTARRPTSSRCAASIPSWRSRRSPRITPEIGRIQARQLRELRPAGATSALPRGAGGRRPRRGTRLEGFEDAARKRGYRGADRERRLDRGERRQSGSRAGCGSRRPPASCRTPSLCQKRSTWRRAGPAGRWSCQRPEWGAGAVLARLRRAAGQRPQGRRRGAARTRPCIAAAVVRRPAIELALRWKRDGVVPPAETVLAPSPYRRFLNLGADGAVRRVRMCVRTHRRFPSHARAHEEAKRCARRTRRARRTGLVGRRRWAGRPHAGRGGDAGRTRRPQTTESVGTAEVAALHATCSRRSRGFITAITGALPGDSVKPGAALHGDRPQPAGCGVVASLESQLVSRQADLQQARQQAARVKTLLEAGA